MLSVFVLCCMSVHKWNIIFHSFILDPKGRSVISLCWEYKIYICGIQTGKQKGESKVALNLYQEHWRPVFVKMNAVQRNIFSSGFLKKGFRTFFNAILFIISLQDRKINNVLRQIKAITYNEYFPSVYLTNLYLRVISCVTRVNVKVACII